MKQKIDGYDKYSNSDANSLTEMCRGLSDSSGKFACMLRKGSKNL